MKPTEQIDTTYTTSARGTPMPHINLSTSSGSAPTPTPTPTRARNQHQLFFVGYADGGIKSTPILGLPLMKRSDDFQILGVIPDVFVRSLPSNLTESLVSSLIGYSKKNFGVGMDRAAWTKWTAQRNRSIEIQQEIKRFLTACAKISPQPLKMPRAVVPLCKIHNRRIVPTLRRAGFKDSGCSGCFRPVRVAFRNAEARCTIPTARKYKYYGGRGIEFRFADYAQLYAELGSRPSPQHSIDRIINDGHYEPGNVRWATMKEQAANRRKRTKEDFKAAA